MKFVFKYTYSYYTEPLISYTNYTDQLFLQISVLLKHVLQVPMSLYNKQTIPLLADIDTHLGNTYKYTQVHVNTFI